MKYNIEQLFKQELENKVVKPPTNTWNLINNRLINKNFYKYTAAISVFFAFIIIGSIFIFPTSKKTEILTTFASDLTVHNSKIGVLNTDDNSVITQTNTTHHNTNVIVASTVFNNVDSSKDTIIIVNSNKNIVTDTVKSYQGFTLSSTTGCAPLTIVLENIEQSTNLTWQINDEKIKNSPKVVVTLSDVGNYKITLTRDDDGIDNIYTKNVSVYEQPTADFLFNNGIIVNDQIIFENLSYNAKEYIWLVNNQYVSASENLVYSFSKPGNYKVTLIATNENDCSDTLQKNIEVSEPVKHIVCPTAFSPSVYGSNGGYYDENTVNNEVFYPRFFGKEVKDFALKIYDRKGQLLFQSTDYKIGWDGYYRNELSPIGVYIYTINGNFADGTDFHEQGSVTVIYDK